MTSTQVGLQSEESVLMHKLQSMCISTAAHTHIALSWPLNALSWLTPQVAVPEETLSTSLKALIWLDVHKPQYPMQVDYLILRSEQLLLCCPPAPPGGSDGRWPLPLQVAGLLVDGRLVRCCVKPPDEDQLVRSLRCILAAEKHARLAAPAQQGQPTSGNKRSAAVQCSLSVLQ